MLTRMHERESCLTYSYFTNDAIDLLSEKNLDSNSTMFGLLILIHASSRFSHKNMHQRCFWNRSP
jgi:hypothetical protein